MRTLTINLFQVFRTKPFPVNDEQNSFNLTDKSQIGFLMTDYLFHTLVLKRYIHILNCQLNCTAQTQMVGKITSSMHYNHFYEMTLFVMDKSRKTHCDLLGFTNEICIILP